MRIASENDFSVDVPGIGLFRFGRRTYADRLKIRAEYLRLTHGYEKEVEESIDLGGSFSVIAAYKVLCVSCPAGYEDLEAIDLLENEDAEDQIFTIYEALKAKERTFRRTAIAVSEGGGEDSLPDNGVSGTASVPPATA